MTLNFKKNFLLKKSLFLAFKKLALNRPVNNQLDIHGSAPGSISGPYPEIGDVVVVSIVNLQRVKKCVNFGIIGYAHGFIWRIEVIRGL